MMFRSNSTPLTIFDSKLARSYSCRRLLGFRPQNSPPSHCPDPLHTWLWLPYIFFFPHHSRSPQHNPSHCAPSLSQLVRVSALIPLCRDANHTQGWKVVWWAYGAERVTSQKIFWQITNNRIEWRVRMFVGKMAWYVNSNTGCSSIEV